MSIIVSGLNFAFPNKERLLSDISFSVNDGRKASLIGNNGCGKSTLLKLIAGGLDPLSGEVTVRGAAYVVPQHFGQYDGMTISAVLGVDSKISALNSILAGSTDPDDYERLHDDWDIEQRMQKELDHWEVGYLSPGTQFSSISGGEKTRVLLAGIGLGMPSVVLMDEPTNHLDRQGRDKLYELIGSSPATMLIVSHDRQLLDLLDITLELTAQGIKRYGGNYGFYKRLHDQHLQALAEGIEEREKNLRQAVNVARKATERKNKADARGERKQKAAGIPRILMGGIKDSAEKSSSKLKEVLAGKTARVKEELSGLKDQLHQVPDMRINFKDTEMHRGKTLVDARGINYRYTAEGRLWNEPLEILIQSGDRVFIEGPNGSGKTTLLRLITGELQPCCGVIERSDFRYVYIDQEYTLIDNNLTVYGQIEQFNRRNLPEHRLKTELHRFLFPAAAWDDPCSGLSGGEKMRLLLCCMLVIDDTPDVIILDEPTNNLDINSMEILTTALRKFGGTLLVISHDSRFIEETGITARIVLPVRWIGSN